MTDAESTTIEQLQTRFGPLYPPAVKPFSLTFRTIDQTVIIKVYRDITPVMRQQRECDALRIAPTLGLKVPRVLDTGHIDAQPWTAFELVPGDAGNLNNSGRQFLAQAASVMTTLHHHVNATGAGAGWTGVADPRRSNSEHLMSQLSPRASTMPWWPTISEKINELDQQSTVYLHGDLKAEHILTTSAGLCVVDWEACARGPAVSDHADTYFHLARDLIYGGNTRTAIEATHLPTGLRAALAWRLVLWADRRRDQDLANLPAALLCDLATGRDPQTTLRDAAAIIEHMHRLGTPR